MSRVTGLATFKDLCIDANDAGALAAFWGPTLGRDVRRLDDGDCVLTGPTPQHTIWVNTVAEPHTVKNRMHIDVHTRSVSSLVERGVTVVDDQSFSWTTMLDPEGNEFCAFTREEDRPELLYELGQDCADPEPLALWWQALLGGDVGNDADEGWWWLEHIPGAPFESIVFAKVPEPKTVKNRMHVDVVATDRDAVLAHGARVLAELEHWTVMADPEGNEFCVFPPA